MVLRELFVKLGLDVNSQSFTKGMLAAEGIKGALEKIAEYAGEAVSAFDDVIKETVNLGRASQYTGIATDALQELRSAAERSGVGVESLDMSVFRLARSIAAAQKGTGEQAEAFKRLGVSLTGPNGKLKTADEMIMDLSDSFSKMPDGVDKTALAIQLFGRAGAHMIPLLNKGRDALREMREEAPRLSEASIKEGEKLHEMLERLSMRSRQFFFEKIVPKVLPLIEKGLRVVSNAMRMASGLFDFLAKNIGTVEAMIVGLTAALVIMNAASIAAAIASAAAWAAALWPLAAIGAALALILLVFDDIRGYNEGEDSLFGDFMNAFDDFMKPKAGEPWFVTAIRSFVQGLKDATEYIRYISNWERLKQDLKELPGAVAQTIVNSPTFGGQGTGPRAGEGAGIVPRATLPGSAGNTSNSKVVNVSPTINVIQSPGQSPEETAKATREEIHRLFENAGAAVE